MLCLSATVYAQQAHCTASAPAATAATAASASTNSILAVTSLPPHFSGDDPEHVRDALAAATSSSKKPGANPTITGRVRSFLARPFHRTSSASVPSKDERSQAERTFAFVIPASYGVRFESRKKLLSVNVSLAAPEQPDLILLKRKVEGQSGRKLVIAPEAKAKGFIQTIDTIQLDTDDRAKTSVRGSALLPGFDPSHGSGDFAIVLVCSLEPPYLSDRSEHSDPTDEEPTDITRRTSTLHGRIDAVWLIDRNTGTIVTRRLRLVK
ncbi:MULTISPECIES: hypothetical protein [unclassified Caballeronia]|uniref:hypothetical protein n=1 Tax=unclassified Caballeronia TaxID=2646786 RepID=UPI00285E2ABC|nr:MULTISPECIES: hypothetical protein [unclassified Caballeronia]MDR5740455.1 hypothetical protein [Caballeronia sp. LZ016]MDR5809024.1 hypothetical protein [Caballeronia sp. LZ019]